MRAAWLGLFLIMGCEAGSDATPCDASALCCCAGDSVRPATCESGKPTCSSPFYAVPCANVSSSAFCRFEGGDGGSPFAPPDTSEPAPADVSVDAADGGDASASDSAGPG